MIKKLHIDGPFIMRAVIILILACGAIQSLTSCSESAKPQNHNTDFSSPSNPYFTPQIPATTVPQGPDVPNGVIRGVGVWYICEPDGTTTYISEQAILNIPHSKYCPSK